MRRRRTNPQIDNSPRAFSKTTSIPFIPDEPVHPDLPGFVFKRLLGRGGMAAVWEAEQLDPLRVVAIKVLNSDFAKSPSDIENFYSEAKIAAELDHENIVTVFEVGCHEGIYYYVMELASGYDTGTWLRRKGHLDETSVLTIAESVGVALQYAMDELGIIHRDIKPENIMVDGDGTVRLTDLGIACFVSGKNPDDEYVSGTPAYMSPEQVAGAPDIDVRADIYSLGATMYHLVTGRTLFHGHTDDFDLMNLQRTAQVPDLRTFNPAISAPFAKLVACFLAKDRSKRPQNWDEALRDIRRVLRRRNPRARLPQNKESTMALLPGNKIRNARRTFWRLCRRHLWRFSRRLRIQFNSFRECLLDFLDHHKRFVFGILLGLVSLVVFFLCFVVTWICIQ